MPGEGTTGDSAPMPSLAVLVAQLAELAAALPSGALDTLRKLR
jgi:hypothetical protein